MKRIIAPLKQKENLKVREKILFSGVLYTARDQAHQKLAEAIKQKKKIPFEIKGQIIYYCGPTPAPRGKIVGSCGPTTSARMDEFTPILLKAGLKGMIGKGSRTKEVIKAIKKYKAVYFLTYAGCGALLSKFVKSKRLVAYKDLGPEAIYTFTVKDFPLIVGVDAKGRSIYGKK